MMEATVVGLNNAIVRVTRNGATSKPPIRVGDKIELSDGDSVELEAGTALIRLPDGSLCEIRHRNRFVAPTSPLNSMWFYIGVVTGQQWLYLS